jgi:tetratricopeptide (TPR) repeat protein
MAAGDLDGAFDGFEAALAIQPGSARLVMDLAEAARAQGMQGKALHYYRAVLTRDPGNVDAIAGEGGALAEARWTRRSAIWPGCRRSVAIHVRPRAIWPP